MIFPKDIYTFLDFPMYMRNLPIEGKSTFSVIKHVEKPTVGEIPTNTLHVKCCAFRGRVKNWLENNHPYILHLIKIISPIRDKVIVTIRQILKAL